MFTQVPPRRVHALALTTLLSWAALSCGGDTGTGPGDQNPTADTGILQVSVTTSGDDLDTDGYTLSVGSANVSVPSTGSATFADLQPGTITVQMSEVAENCAVAGSNPRSVTIQANSTTTATFEVGCTFNAASLVSMAIQSLEDNLFEAASLDEDELSSSDLDKFSFGEARDLFEQALNQEPTNETAALGLTVTTIFVLEDNTELRQTADDWDLWLETHDEDDLIGAAVIANAGPLFWSRASLPLELGGTALRRAAHLGDMMRVFTLASSMDDFPPTLAHHQQLARDIVAPALESALEALEGVVSSDFTFEITARMQGENPGEADVLELDMTEILALRGALEASLATVDIVNAYIMEPSIWGADAIVSASQPGSTFGTLASNGATLLADARERLLRATDHAQAGLDFLENESDDQSNDVIKRGDDLSSEDIDEARDALADVEAGLQGPRTITEDFGGEGDSITVTVDASRFFLNPILDLKAVSPDYEVFKAGNYEGIPQAQFRFTALNLDEWIFPNPSFNGVFPNISTSAQLIDTFGSDLEGLFYDNNPVGDYYRLITVNGIDCDAASQGCLTDTGLSVDNARLDFGNHRDTDAVAHLSFTLLQGGSFVQSIELLGLYTATRLAGGEISLQLDLVTSAGSPAPITATLVDRLGWTGEDSRGRSRGGSSITFVGPFGGTWVMERQ